MNSSFPEHADREPAVPLRVGTYNLMDGSKDKWPGQMDLLASLDLDILCLQEAKDWDRNLRERVYATAERLRLCPQFAPSAWHGSHLVTLYRSSRLTCIGFTPDVASSRFHHRMSRSVFQIPGLEGDASLDVIHTHLDPFDPQDRLAEVSWLTEQVTPGPYTLLVGDLSSIGAGDAEPDDWSKVPAHLQSRHRMVMPDGTYGGVDRRAINVLMAAGYVDPPVHLDTPVPPTAGYWSDDAEQWDHRSDHILASLSLAPSLRSYTVVDTPETRRLSDHLPVVTTHDLARCRTATANSDRRRMNRSPASGRDAAAATQPDGAPFWSPGLPISPRRAAACSGQMPPTSRT